MSSQKLSNIKIPSFDKANYTLRKKKMILFIRMANPMYVGILKNGHFIPMVSFLAITEGFEVSPAQYVPKDPTNYTNLEKQKVALDSSL